MAFYSVEQDPKKSTITVYEFDEDFKLRNGKDNIFGKAGFGGGCEQYEIDGFVIINDLCITKNYYVTTSVGVEIDGLKYNLFKDPKSSIKRLLPFSKIYLLNKMKKEVVSVEVKNDEFGDLRNFQIANSYEDEEGRIIIDGVRSHSDSGVKTRVGNVSEKKLWRYIITNNGQLISAHPILKDSGVCTSFTSVDKRESGIKHSAIYANLGSLGQGIGSIDVSTGLVDSWYPDSKSFCGSPTFVSTPTSSYILTILRTPTESSLLIFKSTSISSGPISTVPLNAKLPHGLHGCWTEQIWGEEEIKRTAKLYDKLESKGQMFNEVKSDFSGLGLRLDDFDEYGF